MKIHVYTKYKVIIYASVKYNLSIFSELQLQKKKKLQTWTQTKCFSAEALAKGRKGTFNDRQRIMGASLLDRIKQITPYKLEKQNLFSYEVCIM